MYEDVILTSGKTQDCVSFNFTFTVVLLWLYSSSSSSLSLGSKKKNGAVYALVSFLHLLYLNSCLQAVEVFTSPQVAWNFTYHSEVNAGFDRFSLALKWNTDNTSQVKLMDGRQTLIKWWKSEKQTTKGDQFQHKYKITMWWERASFSIFFGV